MDTTDSRARWMRSRGVEIYTPPTLTLLEAFEQSREFDEAIANAFFACESNHFSELMGHMPVAVVGSLLNHLERQGINNALPSINGALDEIGDYTAAANGWLYDTAARERDTSVAAIHFIDSLMFGLRITMAFASDAYLSKCGIQTYSTTPARASILDDLAAITKNDSFRDCLKTFAGTGFGVIGDSMSTTKIDKDAGASWRMFGLSDVANREMLFWYDARLDNFTVNPHVELKLKQVLQQQNRGEHAFHSEIIVGHIEPNATSVTAGCTERYKLPTFSQTGIQRTAEFSAHFFTSMANFIRLRPFTTPDLRKLAQLALKDDAQDVRLLVEDDTYGEDELL